MLNKETILQDFPLGIKGLIFDCDGVIIDSRQANVGFYNKIRQAFSLPELTLEQEDYVHMCSGIQAFEYIVPKNLQSQIKSVISQVDYEESVSQHLSLYEGVSDTLLSLKKAGYKVGMHTNRSQGIYELLESFKLTGIFDPIMHCKIVKTKPDPEGVFKILEAWNCTANEVIFVGDSETDLMASQSAGVAMISFQNPKLNAKLGVADSFLEIKQLFVK